MGNQSERTSSAPFFCNGCLQSSKAYDFKDSVNMWSFSFDSQKLGGGFASIGCSHASRTSLTYDRTSCRAASSTICRCCRSFTLNPCPIMLSFNYTELVGWAADASEEQKMLAQVTPKLPGQGNTSGESHWILPEQGTKALGQCENFNPFPAM